MFDINEWNESSFLHEAAQVLNRETNQTEYLTFNQYIPYWFSNPEFCTRHGLVTYADFIEWAKPYAFDRESYLGHVIRDFFNTRKVSTDSQYVYITSVKSHIVSSPEQNLYSLVYHESASLRLGTGPFVLVDIQQKTKLKRLTDLLVNHLGVIEWRWEYSSSPLKLNIPKLYTTINNYSYKKAEPTFFSESGKKSSELYFGLELELSTNLTPAEISYIVSEVEPKQPLFFFFKSDSSVRGSKDFNIELVTDPCTPGFLKKNFRLFFNKLDKLCEAKGLTISDVFDTSVVPSNGLHIHVSDRSFFSDLERNKFVSLWNLWDSKSIDFIQSISRRVNPYHENRYCLIHPGIKDRTLPFRLRSGDSQERSRHSVCHTTGQTVEVRVFQSIFDLQHIINTITIVEAMHQFNHETGYRVLKSDLRSSFEDWLFKQGKYTRVKRIIKGEK